MLSIGLSGSNLAGKGAARAFIEKNFKTYSISFSDLLREDLVKAGKELKREVLIGYANDLRKAHDADILAKRAVERVTNANPQVEVVLYDSVRTVAEIEFLKRKYGEHFKFLFIDAPVEIRYQRSLQRGRAMEDKSSFEQFKINDEAESGKSGQAYVQQLIQCKEIADYVIINDSTKEKLEGQVVSVIKRHLR